MKFLKETCINKNNKLKIFIARVKFSLLYYCETWLSTGVNISKIKAFVNGCLNIIMNISWPRRIPNNYL